MRNKNVISSGKYYNLYEQIVCVFGSAKLSRDRLIFGCNFKNFML